MKINIRSWVELNISFIVLFDVYEFYVDADIHFCLLDVSMSKMKLSSVCLNVIYIIITNNHHNKH